MNNTRQIMLASTPVVINGDKTGNPSSQKATLVNTDPVSSFGAVDKRGAFSPGRNSTPNDITVRFDNIATGTATTFIFGDADVIIQGVLGVTYAKPTIPASNIDAVNKMLANNNAVFKSMNYRITTGTSAQFSNKLQYANADIDGSVNLKPMNIQSAQRNTQQNDKILTMEAMIFMDGSTGIIVTVAANSAVELDFSFAEISQGGGNF